MLKYFRKSKLIETFKQEVCIFKIGWNFAEETRWD